MENFLKANPGKFQFMILGKKQSNRVKSKINSTVFSESDTMELLAIITDNRLTPNNHINNLCHNAIYKNMKILNSGPRKTFSASKEIPSFGDRSTFSHIRSSSQMVLLYLLRISFFYGHIIFRIRTSQQQSQKKAYATLISPKRPPYNPRHNIQITARKNS